MNKYRIYGIGDCSLLIVGDDLFTEGEIVFIYKNKPKEIVFTAHLKNVTVIKED